jgi:hypothetical protein
MSRCLSLVAAVAFAATSPGLSGFEVVGHLSGLVDLAHERQPHFEEAGQSGHTDECQLGTAAFGIRLPSLGAPTLRLFAEPAFEPAFTGVLTPTVAPLDTSLPRAPPA